MEKRPPKTFVGCCGFARAQADYCAEFPCVEIDSSFYNLPKLETATRWRRAAPAHFQFALKAWQVITHDADSPTYRRTRLDQRDRAYCGGFRYNPTTRWAWDQTYQVAKAMSAFLVLFQCPTSFRPNKDNVAQLRQFFERAKRGKFALGWEPRGAWEPALVAELCRELDLVHVHDPLQTSPATTSRLRYYRLHGTTGRGHRFSAAELERLATICHSERATSYCLFNNTAMAADARRFQQLLTRPDG